MNASPNHLDSPIGVVVVNYGSSALVRANIAAFADAIVIVVDNFSSATERSTLKSLCDERGWTFIGLPDNRGFGHGVNMGVARVRKLGCSSVLLLNPDAQVSPEVLTALRLAVLENPGALLSPVILDSQARVVFQGVEVDARSGRIVRAGMTPSSRVAWPWLTAACLAVSVELFDRVGGFDDGYFLYWEDVDFTHRAALAGAELIVREDLRAIHDEGLTQGDQVGTAKSFGYYYFNSRNRLVFGAQHLSRVALLRWMLWTPYESWAILLRGGRRQLLHSRAPLRAIITGSGAGLWRAAVALIRRPVPRVAP